LEVDGSDDQAGGDPAGQMEGTMDTILWIAQVVLAVLFLLFGVTHLTRRETMRERVPWMWALPREAMFVIGTLDILGAIGLILPAVTRIQPWLTPLAALCLAVLMVFAIIFHATRRELPNNALNGILGLLAAFVAWGRFIAAPF
jgi:putative oxidoreductase